jgi:hypothetical protein
MVHADTIVGFHDGAGDFPGKNRSAGRARRKHSGSEGHERSARDGVHAPREQLMSDKATMLRQAAEAS